MTTSTTDKLSQIFKGKVYITFQGTDKRTGKISNYSIDGFWKTPSTANEVNARLAANGGKVAFLENAQIVAIQSRSWVAGEFRI